MIYHRKFYQRNGQVLDHYVLKYAHQRDLIPHLDPDIVAEKRITIVTFRFCISRIAI